MNKQSERAKKKVNPEYDALPIEVIEREKWDNFRKAINKDKMFRSAAITQCDQIAQLCNLLCDMYHSSLLKEILPDLQIAAIDDALDYLEKKAYDMAEFVHFEMYGD